MTALSSSLARGVLAMVSRLVPSDERRDWRAAWNAELTYLESLRRRGAATGMPGPLRLVLGALPHSLWERKEWTLTVLLQDVRYALRVLRANPVFTAMAVLTLALGIGANTTIFSMTNATLLRAPGAIEEPGRIVQIARDRPDEGFDNLAYPYYRLFRDNARSLQSVSAYTSRRSFLGRDGDLIPFNTQLVTGEYFRVLGLAAQTGRLLHPSDDVPGGSDAVVVLGHGSWRRLFASDPDIVGSTIQLNGSSFEVIGIAPEGFTGTDVLGQPTDGWVAMSQTGALLGDRYAFTEIDDPGFSWLWMIGRLAEDSTSAAAREELTGLYARAYEANWGDTPDHPIGALAGVGLRPEARAELGSLLAILSAVVAVVLAIACANLANLLLARGMSRARELGIRTALGAGRVRIVRQLLTESVLLALGGGLLAFAVTWWTARALPTLLPVSMSVSFRPDFRVFGFAAALSLLAGLVFGLVPALRASRSDIVGALQRGTPGGGHRGTWLRSSLVVGQLALSFALLAATALLVRSLWAAQSAEPGYATRTVSTLTFSVETAGYDPTTAQQLYRDLDRQAAALPGVEAAGLASNLPFGGWSRRSVVWPEPRPEAERPFTQVDWTSVTPGFFDTLGLRFVAGAPFSEAEAAPDAPGVAVISRAAAELLFPGEQALGQLIPLDEERTPESSIRVVGIVADVQMRSLQEAPRASVYAPLAQSYGPYMTVYARSDRPTDEVTTELRALLARNGPEVGVMAQGSLHQRMAESLRDTTMVARLAGIFGGLAALLAGMGLYGVMAFLASSRRHEVGVRMALGARRGEVLRLFVRQALLLALIGVAVGVALTLALGGTLSNLLYGITATEPGTLVVIGLAVVLLAISAALAPAYRATRVAPVTALRSD